MQNESSTLNDSGTLQRGVKQVGESLHSTIDRVAEPALGAVERVSNTAHETVNRVANKVTAAAERLDIRLEHARGTPNYLVDCTRDYVASRPLKAVAAALALGWLLGRLGAR